jgi:chemotaxis signal transduction protein
LNLVCFQQDGIWYGVPASDVTDLLPAVQIEPLGLEQRGVLGVVVYARSSWLAIHLGLLMQPTEPWRDRALCDRYSRRKTSLLVVGSQGHEIALPTKKVSCVMDVEPDRLRPAVRSRHEPSAICARLDYLDRSIRVLEVNLVLQLAEAVCGIACWQSWASDVCQSRVASSGSA